MPAVTPYQLYETQNYIVDHINAIVNQVANGLNRARGAPTQTPQFIDYKIREITNALEVIILAISDTRLGTLRIQDRIIQSNDEEHDAGPSHRTFFTNLHEAIDVTSSLLSHVPPTRYTLPTASLPLNELYGLLHALHRNSLEWLTHINYDIEKVAETVKNLEATLINELRAINRRIDTVIQRFANIESKLDMRAEPNLEGDLVKILTSIETQVQALHTRLREMSANEGSNSGGNPRPQLNENSTASRNELPAFIPEHPTDRCRSYGSVEFEGVNLHIPMDVRGRRASTALRLLIKHTIKREATIAKFELFDDGALLLTEEIGTPHKFDHPFTDSLALLHSKCPNFLYKIRDDRLC
nr:TGB3 [Garlic virus X]